MENLSCPFVGCYHPFDSEFYSECTDGIKTTQSFFFGSLWASKIFFIFWHFTWSYMIIWSSIGLQSKARRKRRSNSSFNGIDYEADRLIPTCLHVAVIILNHILDARMHLRSNHICIDPNICASFFEIKRRTNDDDFSPNLR